MKRQQRAYLRLFLLASFLGIYLKIPFPEDDNVFRVVSSLGFVAVGVLTYLLAEIHDRRVERMVTITPCPYCGKNNGVYRWRQEIFWSDGSREIVPAESAKLSQRFYCKSCGNQRYDIIEQDEFSTNEGVEDDTQNI